MTTPEPTPGEQFAEFMTGKLGQPDNQPRDAAGRFATADPVEALAAMLGSAGATEPTPAAEPVPRLPAPNPAQGSSGNQPPRPPDPRERFAEEIAYRVRSARGDGGWREMTP